MRKFSNVSQGLPVLLFLIGLLGCNQSTDQHTASSDVVSKQVTLEEVDRIALKGVDTVIGYVSGVSFGQDRFLIWDNMYSQSCLLFDMEGHLLKTVGKRGQGPGEHSIINGACISNDRIHLVSTNARHNIYSIDGIFEISLPKPFKGSCNSVVCDEDGGAYLLSLSQYSPSTIYHTNDKGELLNSFSPPERDVPTLYDAFYPQSSLLVDDSVIFQAFNYSNHILKFDKSGNQTDTIVLESPSFILPDHDLARKVHGLKQEKHFRSTFTQLCGIYSLDNAYVTRLRIWDTPESGKDLLEFWSTDFLYVGEFTVCDDELFVGTHEGLLVFARLNPDSTYLIFRKRSHSKDSY